jgi:CubicO group peptidase (beta-lactamase class C family)
MKKIVILTLIVSQAISMSLFSQPMTMKIDSIVSAYTNIQEFNGSVLVAKKGEILLSKGYGYADQATKRLNTETTIFGIASVTKTFTSAMVLKLVEKKQLSLNDKLSKFYPGYRFGNIISIGQLLSHTSGIDDRAIAESKEKFDRTALSREQILLEELNRSELSSKPGTVFNYSNRGYYLLGNIISMITKMSYEQAIRKYIFTPFGLKNSGFDFAGLKEVDRARGYWAEKGKDYSKETPLMDSAGTYAAGAIYSNVLDLYKWHNILQNYKFISKKTLESAYYPYTKKYGYGWTIDSIAGKRRVAHSGSFWGFRSNFARITEDDMVVILLSNFEVTGLNMITNDIFSALYNKPYKLPRKKVAVNLSTQQLIKYVGTYEVLEPNLILEVKFEDGELRIYPKNGNRSDLLAESEDHFYDKIQESLEIVFGKDSNGKDIMTIIMGESIRVANLQVK